VENDPNFGLGGQSQLPMMNELQRSKILSTVKQHPEQRGFDLLKEMTDFGWLVGATDRR
jgi:hypothetical protein